MLIVLVCSVLLCLFHPTKNIAPHYHFPFFGPRRYAYANLHSSIPSRFFASSSIRCSNWIFTCCRSAYDFVFICYPYTLCFVHVVSLCSLHDNVFLYQELTDGYR